MLDHYTNGLFCCSDKFILPYKSPSYNTVNIHHVDGLSAGLLGDCGAEKVAIMLSREGF